MFQPEREKDWYEDAQDQICELCPSLTWTQRVGGCAICMLTGFLLSMGSTFRLMTMLKGDPVPFATMFTLGNILALCSTCFLYGPSSQAKKMFDSTRFLTTCAYFICMGTTLFLAFYGEAIPGRGYLIVVAIVLQFFALYWYTLSYIPYGREMAWGCISKIFVCNGCNCGSEGGSSEGGISNLWRRIDTSSEQHSDSTSSWPGL